MDLKTRKISRIQIYPDAYLDVDGDKVNEVLLVSSVMKGVEPKEELCYACVGLDVSSDGQSTIHIANAPERNHEHAIGHELIQVKKL